MGSEGVAHFFQALLSKGYIRESELLQTDDGFCMVYKALSEILAEEDIFDFIDS